MTQEIQCENCGKIREVKTINAKKWYESRYPKCRACAGAEKRSAPKDLGRRFIYRTYRRNAHTRGIEFDVDFDEFVSCVEGPCIYCGLTSGNIVNMDEWFDYRDDIQKYPYTGIDRIDSNKGYVSGNCQSCCKHCNRAKWDRPQEEFFAWIDRVYDHKERRFNED